MRCNSSPSLRVRGRARGFTLVEIMVVIGIIGMLAAIVVPTIMKAQARAQDRVVMGNMRQLALATDQYCTVNGTSTVSLSELVGPTKYIKELKVVAGEVYPSEYTVGVSIVVSGVGGNRTLVFAN